MLAAVESSARGFHADQLYGLLGDEHVEDAHRVGSPTDAGNNGRWQSAGCLQHLRLGFATDDRLKIANHARIGRRPYDRTDDVVAVVDVGDPVPDGLAGGVL